MGGKGGEIDTSGMTAAMQGQQKISQQEMDLANQMFSYGVGRTRTYADPLLNEFARIMGYGPTAGSEQVMGPAAAPAASPAPAAAAATSGMPGGYSAVANMFIDPNTGQLYGGDMVQPVGSGYALKPPGNWGGGYAVPSSLGATVEPYGGSAQNLGIGAATPWSGAAPATAAPGTTPPPGRYVSPVESSLFQLPVATSQAQLKQTIDQIKRTVPPGPQQTAMINDARNKMNQNIGQAAFGTVTNMMNALLGTSSAAQTGMQQAAGAMSAASAAQGAAGQMAATIAGLQMQAQSANNTMLAGIFSSIGQMGGQAMSSMGSGSTLMGMFGG